MISFFVGVLVIDNVSYCEMTAIYTVQQHQITFIKSPFNVKGYRSSNLRKISIFLEMLTFLQLYTNIIPY